ncbi:MAG: hypothetical protein GXY77_17500 [Fibrobacter sp.]|nr:hypothetical protein [Fibrobacter sp.]
MKVVMTVTAIYDVPDNTEFVEVEEKGESYGMHIVVDGHKFQPVVEFLEYQGKVEGNHSWGEPDEEVVNRIYDGIEDEAYTLMLVKNNDEEENPID